MSEIQELRAREVLDSRGNPTLEVEVHLDSAVCGRAMVPSGASTGTHEALELRDGDRQRYLGKGVRKAVANVGDIIAAAFVGQSVLQQQELDRQLVELDGTPAKTKLGANATLGVSLAVARAAAAYKRQPLFVYLGSCFGVDKPTLLPVPMMNILNGGAHADNNLDIQEFMIAPIGFSDFPEALRSGVEVFHHLKAILKQKGYATNVGDEGGYAPDLKSNEEAFELIAAAVEAAGYNLGQQIYLACDAAASEFHVEGRYRVGGQALTTAELIDYYDRLCRSFPIYSLEDPLHEEDWQGWQQLNRKLGDRLQLVGDDIYVTHPKLLERGIAEAASNGILLKLNQIGTLTETMETMKLARGAGWSSVISHRSGETSDAFIADLAVASEAAQIKTGSLCRSDRVAKYNQLLRIHEQLGERARYAGTKVLRQ